MMSAVLKELGFEKEKYILLTHDEAFFILYYQSENRALAK